MVQHLLRLQRPTPVGTAILPVGCTNAVTTPSDTATVSGTIEINVTNTCDVSGSFTRLYIANKTYDFASTLPFNTNTMPDDTYGIGIITWDNTGLVKLAQSTINITISNNSATPTPNPTPTPGATPTSISSGCNGVITSPVDGSVVSGNITVSVSNTCPGEYFNRLYNLGSKSYDFKNSLSLDTTRVANGTYGIAAITWDATGRIKRGLSQTVTIRIANGAVVTPTPTPRATPTLIATPTPAVNAAVRANDFLNSMGVGTKVIQGDSIASTISGFQYLGLRNGRDDATHKTSGSGSVASLCQIHAATGVMYDELPIVDADPNNLVDTKAEWDQLAACGAMVAGEGPNEPNNFGFNYNGQGCNGSTMVGCAAFMKDLYNLVHTDTTLAGLKLWGMTEVGEEQENDGLQFLTVPAASGSLAATGTKFADVANTHNYVQGNGPVGQTPIDNQVRQAETIMGGPWDTIGEYWGLTWNKGFAGASMGQNDRPKVTTETGWHVFAHGSTITRDMQGKLIADLWFDAFQLGWQKTYVYEMFERPPFDAGYGFLNLDGTSTPMGTFTHNLTIILADTAATFTPGSLNYSISGLPSTGYCQLLQKGDGTFELVVWGEAFASQTATPITVNLGAAYSTVKVYDVTIGTTPIQTLSGVSAVPITLSDHPIIIEFSA